MARTSRRTNRDTEPLVINNNPLYKTAVYARLSVEDKGELSIENQVLKAKRFIEQNAELSFCGVFSDNGATGTNFNRAGFEKLMDEIRRGNINCIVVKDLSRFGRDYIEAGNYLEVIFPKLGIRFISIDDNYDNLNPRCQGDDMSVALKNMIHTFYAKDISTKIKSAYSIKHKNGEFTGKCPPFGYLKSPENKNKLIIDAIAADVVHKIFKLKLEGLSVNQIARLLSKENIISPGHYRYIHNIHKEERYKNPQAWDHTVIKDMLESVVYLGHLALGKTRINANGKQEAVPKNEWVIKENTHEAIISQEEFNIVQKQLFETAEKHKNLNSYSHEELPENLLKGLIFCSDCGRTYRRIVNKMRDHFTYRKTYICVHCNNNSPKYKYQHFKQSDLYEAVYISIRKQIDLCVNICEKIKQIDESAASIKYKDEIKDKTLNIQNRLNRIDVFKLKLYNNLVEKIINETEYNFLNAQYEKEIIVLLSELEDNNEKKKKMMPQFTKENIWISSLKHFINKKELTREMVLTVIERIEVNAKREVNIKFHYDDELKYLSDFIKEREEFLNE